MITLINFKTYKQGKDVLKLAKAIDRVRKKTNKEIIAGVQVSDLYKISKETGLKVFSQHVNGLKTGRNTGFVIPEAVKENGAKGTFLNHSEHKLKFSELKNSVNKSKKVGLKTAVFASDLKEAKKVEKLNPDYLIVEPPELVAGKTSVSNAKPELIKKISEKLDSKFLVGAGIKTKNDVKKALELGASGIAVSSAIVKAKNPEKKLKELIDV